MRKQQLKESYYFNQQRYNSNFNTSRMYSAFLIVTHKGREFHITADPEKTPKSEGLPEINCMTSAIEEIKYCPIIGWKTYTPGSFARYSTFNSIDARQCVFRKTSRHAKMNKSSFSRKREKQANGTMFVLR